MRPLTRSCFLLLPVGRLFLLALPFLLGTCLPSLLSPPFPPHAPALISLTLSKVRLSTTLTLSNLTIWYFGHTALFHFPFGKDSSAVLASMQQTQYAQVSPLKPPPFCKLFAGLGSINKSVTSLLILSEYRSILTSLLLLHLVEMEERTGWPFTSISGADPAGTVFSFFLFYQITMSPQTFVSPGERRGE